MRTVAILVLASLLLAGCTMPAATPEAPRDLRASAPPALPDGARMEGAELVAREPTRATFQWAGAFEPGTLGSPVGTLVSRDPITTALHLPADAPLRVEATLRWPSAADLSLQLIEGSDLSCSTPTRGLPRPGGPGGEERCVAWTRSGPARTWEVVVEPMDAPSGATFEVEVILETYTPAPAYDLAAGPAARAEVPDASTAGPARTTAVEYDFGLMPVQDPGSSRPYAIRVLGVLHFPTELEGPLPLVVLMHGRHGSCRGPAGAGGVLSHCRGADFVAEPVRSHRGYDDVAALLASQGYVVASIDANDINALDGPPGVPRGDDGSAARVDLFLRTLDDLRRVHESGGAPTNPALDALRGRLDLERIGLMGHSRGADAVSVTPAAAIARGHWAADAIRAVYSLAGTTRPFLPAYTIPTIPTHVAYAGVSPYCDGDVSMLGQYDFHDHFAAQREHGELVHLLFMGANHNYYNTAWWDGDDAGFAWGWDTHCHPERRSGASGDGRLSAEDQARHQRVYLPAWFRLQLGGERAFAPLFEGAAPPTAACPAALSHCPGLLHASVLPASARLLRIEDASTSDALAVNDLGSASTFTGFADARVCDPRERIEGDPCRWPRALGDAPRLRLAWNVTATWRTELPTAHADLSAFDTLAFRIGLDFEDGSPPDGWPARITIALEDGRGRRAEVLLAEHSGAPFPPPGTDARRVTLDQARVPFDAFAKVDLGNVRAVELRFDGATPGAVHVADLVLMWATSSEAVGRAGSS